MNLRDPRLAAAAVIAAVAAACTTAPIYDVRDASLGGNASIEQRTSQIARAARMQNWEVETLQPNVMLVTKRKGRHTATATLRYDEQSLSIGLRNSVDFKQSESRIHKLYNEWIKSLEATIRREVSAPGY